MADDRVNVTYKVRASVRAKLWRLAARWGMVRERLADEAIDVGLAVLEQRRREQEEK